MFAAGLTLFFTRTLGDHPFGPDVPGSRKFMIYRGMPAEALISVAESRPLLNDLISAMICHDPNKRPTMDECGSHPFFWGSRESLEKCRLARGRVDLVRPTALHEKWHTEWMRLLPAEVVEPLSKQATYKNNLRDLLRFVDNLSKHLHECEPKLVRVVMGADEKSSVQAFLENNRVHSDGAIEAVMYFFSRHLPRLLLSVQRVQQAVVGLE